MEVGGSITTLLSMGEGSAIAKKAMVASAISIHNPARHPGYGPEITHHLHNV